MEFKLLSSFSFSHSLPYAAGASAEGAVATILMQIGRPQARARVKGKRGPLRAEQAECAHREIMKPTYCCGVLDCNSVMG